MAEYIAEINKDVALVGNRLIGKRNHANKGRGFISIKGFSCKVAECNDTKCQTFTNTYFAPYFSILAGNLEDSMSGRRGILEPESSYSGPLLRNSKNPPKGSQHRPIFSVSKINEHPAICYPDILSTNKVQQSRVERQKVYLK